MRRRPRPPHVDVRESAALKCHSHVRKKGMYRRSLSSLLSAVVDVGLSDGTSCSGGAAAAATRPLRILGHKLDRMSSLPRDFHPGGASVTSGTGRPPAGLWSGAKG